MVTIEYVDVFQELLDEAGEHFKEHYKSCEEYLYDKESLSVDPVLFQQTIDSGVANVFKILSDDSLVGYMNVSISPSLILDKPQAVVDFLYILPSKRKEGYGAEAVKEVEEALKEEGITRLAVMLPDKDYSEGVAKGLGYVKTSTVYIKYLGE